MPQYRQATSRFLATVLFTDIVGSTEHAARVGDRVWRDLVEKHHAIVRRELRAFQGREMDTAGDGFFAVFEAPERAVRCAESITTAVAALGISVRAGVHMGECEVIGGKVGGMAVAIGARVAGLAGPGEVLVSGSVRDLMTGSDRRFEGGDPQELKGVSDQWRVYRLVPEEVDGEAVGPRQHSMVPLYTRRQKRRLLVTVAAVVALVLALSGAYVLTRTDPEVVVGENAVGVLDGDRVTSAIDVGERPSGIAVGAGSVWVTNSAEDTVSRIDPDTQAVAPISVGSGPSGIAVGAGAVWVANSSAGTVSRIDPRTNRVTPIRVLPGPTGVVVAAGSVWVTNTLGAAVTRIDPQTGKVLDEVPVGASPTGIAYGAGSLWVTNQSDGTVTRLDPATLRKETPIKVGSGPVGIAVADGAVWVANNLDGTLSRIDVENHSVNARTIDAQGGAYGVAAAGRNVWVSNPYAGTLSRVDSRHFTLVDTVPTRGAPLGLAVSGERLWFASAEAGKALHRGGVLRLAAQGLGGDFGPFDPAAIDPVAYDRYLWRLLAMTNNGLVGFRRTGGVGGSLLVPDLAASLPKPTDDGLTYTFRLRRGVRYSSGDLVRPGDIRRGIERAFGNKDGFFRHYQVIQGAADCRPTAPPCDLSAGIVVADRARTVTFHLTRPEPDFLALLALPAAYATPAGTPLHLQKGAHVPATGPYMVTAYDPAPTGKDGRPTGPGRLELARNSSFREWSGAAQPDGYADRIVIDTGLSQAQTVRRVADGRADAVWEGVPPAQVQGLQAKFPTQVRETAGIYMHFVYLNTTLAPFDNRDARRAVAYGMDRRAMSSDPNANLNAYGFGPLTCQLLPPDSQGYDPYCPYTLPGGGKGSGPRPICSRRRGWSARRARRVRG